MDYTQITPAERAEMLAVIGADSVQDLFEAVPESIRFEGILDLH